MGTPPGRDVGVTINLDRPVNNIRYVVFLVIINRNVQHGSRRSSRVNKTKKKKKYSFVHSTNLVYYNNRTVVIFFFFFLVDDKIKIKKKKKLGKKY